MNKFQVYSWRKIEIMTRFLYYLVWLTCGTLYPAFSSYKAVRNKDAKLYVSVSRYLEKLSEAFLGKMDDVLDRLRSLFGSRIHP